MLQQTLPEVDYWVWGVNAFEAVSGGCPIALQKCCGPGPSTVGGYPRLLTFFAIFFFSASYTQICVTLPEVVERYFLSEAPSRCLRIYLWS